MPVATATMFVLALTVPQSAAPTVTWPPKIPAALLVDVVLTTPGLTRVTLRVPPAPAVREMAPRFTVTAGVVPARVTAPPPLSVVPLKLWALMLEVLT